MPQKLSLYNKEDETASPKLSLYGKGEESKGLLSRISDWANGEFDWYKNYREDVSKAAPKLDPRLKGKKSFREMAMEENPDSMDTEVASNVLGNFVGSPLALAGTAATVASGGLGAVGKLAGAGRTAATLGTAAKVANVADRVVSGATAVSQVPAFGEAMRKGEVGKAILTGAGIGLASLGARANIEHPDVTRFPERRLPSFTIENPSPRNNAALKEAGYLEGPLVPGKGSSKPKGQMMIGDDRVPEVPVGHEGPSLYPRLRDNAVTKANIPYTKQTLKAVKRPVKDAEGKIVLNENGKPTYEKVQKPVPTEPFKDVFKRWANGRRAAEYESAVVKKEFSDLDTVPVSQLASDPVALKATTERLKPYFDKKYGQLTGAGKQLGYREDYIPQMWNNSADEVNTVFGSGSSRLALKKGFEFGRVLENYQEGIAKGLTPKFENVSDLVAFYERHANRAIEDKNFFDYLKNSGKISQRQIAGKEPLPADLFPVSRDKTGKVSPWYAEPEAHGAITGFLESKPPSLYDKATKFLKTTALAAGVPRTAINFHGFSVLARDVMSSEGKLATLAKDVKLMVNPQAGADFVGRNLEHSADAVRSGLQMSTEHIPFRVGGEGSTGFMGWSQRTFEDPLFQGMMPAIKLDKWDTIRGDLIAKGVPTEEAGRLAADQTNHIFGGIDFKTMVADNKFDARMKWLLDDHGSWFLAPQWLASQGYIAKDIAQALRNPADPRGRVYQTMAKNLAVTYTYMNVTNKILSGHWLGENDGGHAFDIDTGQSDDKGKKVFVSPLGTGADFLRIPIEAAFKIGEGDFKGLGTMARGRLGPIAQIATSVGTGRNWAGKPLNSAKDYVGLGADYVPPYVRAAGNLFNEDQSTLQSLTQSVELPLRFRQPEKKKKPNFSF